VEAALWKALRGRGVPDILLNLIEALDHSTGARDRCGKNLSSRFWTTSGVRQGCILAPALFCVANDCIISHMANKPGISLGNSQLTDLVYWDDTALLVQSSAAAATCLYSFKRYCSNISHIGLGLTKILLVLFEIQSSSEQRKNYLESIKILQSYCQHSTPYFLRHNVSHSRHESIQEPSPVVAYWQPNRTTTENT